MYRMASAPNEATLPAHKAFPVISDEEISLKPIEVKRAESLLRKSGEKIFRTLINQEKEKGSRSSASIMKLSVSVHLFEQAIIAQCQRIIDAAKNRAAWKEADKLQECRDGIRMARTEARRALANELKAARERLRKVEANIQEGEVFINRTLAAERAVTRGAMKEKLLKARSRLLGWKEEYRRISEMWASQHEFDPSKNGPVREYPTPPGPAIFPSVGGADIPDAPGIYFLWSGDRISYVGRSVSLTSRLRLGGHHRLTETHRISYLVMPKKDITFAEYYYIGKYCPPLNLGEHSPYVRFKCEEDNAA
jgi:hypothetical protein